MIPDITPQQNSNVHAKYVVHKIEKIPFDNRLFRLIRERVYQLDNMIFNHNNSMGPDYQPTRFSMILPILCGIFTVLQYIYYSFAGSNNNTPGYIFFATPAIMLVLNLLLSYRKIVSLHGWVRKVCYPIFIVVCSLICYGIIVFFGVWLSALFLFIIAIYFAIIAMSGALSPKGNNEAPENRPVVDECHVDDGSFMGLTLSRKEGESLWQGSDGNQYKAIGGGEFRKY